MWSACLTGRGQSTMAEFAYTEALDVLAGAPRRTSARCSPRRARRRPGGVPGRLRPPGAAAADRRGARGAGDGDAGGPGLHHRAAGGQGAGRAGRVWVPVLEQTARIGVLAVSLPDAGPAQRAAGGTARRVRRPGRRRAGPGQRRPAGAAARQAHVAARLHAVGPAAAVGAARPGRAGGRDTRARLRHRGRRLRLRGRRRRAAVRDHRRDGARARLDAARRPRGGRVPARAPRRGVARGDARRHRRGPGQRLRRPLVRHRHPRHARTAAPGGWSGPAPGTRRRCCCAAGR